MKKLRSLVLSLLTVLAPLATAQAAERFNVKVSGHGSPVVLIPGLTCSGQVWDATVKHLEAEHTCHVITLAGFAGVPKASGAEFLVPAREALAEYLTAQKLEKPLVIGHSLGGFLALDLAASHPDLVGRVMVVDAYPYSAGVMQPGLSPDQAPAFAAGMKAQMDQASDEDNQALIRTGRFTRSMVTAESDHEVIVQWGLTSDRHSVSTAMSELLARDLRPELSKIKAPTLVLLSYAAFKPMLNRAMIEGMGGFQYQTLPGVKIAVHDEARHFIMLDAPDWFFGQVDAFLAQR